MLCFIFTIYSARTGGGLTVNDFAETFSRKIKKNISFIFPVIVLVTLKEFPLDLGATMAGSWGPFSIQHFPLNTNNNCSCEQLLAALKAIVAKKILF